MIDINNIENSKFLKDLSKDELMELAIRMRQFILENVSISGGHLSANLGIVDLTIAMLKVFDVEKDIILFDVGHQCYPYKILTGRAKYFDHLRSKGGISGFQSIKESKYDYYEAGHSSTSISTGLGFAIARDLDKKNYNVISVIGDGSIGNGLAYEALNQIGDTKTKQIIILNDNQMSISKNVGAIHNVLDSIRGGKNYTEAKIKTKSFLRKLPFGKIITKIIDKIKNILKKIYLRKGNIFSEFGIEYYGPINGHDYDEMLKYLEIAKNSDKPVILHVITQKGKGYQNAEDDESGKFHGIAPFDITTGQVKTPSNLPSYSEVISSYVYNYAKKDKSIICITPGMCYGSKLEVVKEKLPKQFIDVGIAEEHALVLANGLALAGKKPIVFIYSTFLQRGYDQIVHDIARMNSNVILCIDRAGLVPADGVSHQGAFDVAMLTNVPNMIITSPKDAKEANNLLYTALSEAKPFAIRFPKINLKYDYGKAEKLEIGSWEILKKGMDATLITYGDFTSIALDIFDELQKENININIINARFIKPFDKKLFKQIVSLNKPIFVYEESSKIGSLGSLLSMEIQNLDTISKVYTFGIEDEFLTHATRKELIAMQGLDAKTVILKIKKILQK